MSARVDSKICAENTGKTERADADRLGVAEMLIVKSEQNRQTRSQGPDYHANRGRHGGAHQDTDQETDAASTKQGK